MGHAEVISLDEVRANQRRHQLRQQLRASFEHWLDTLEERMSPTPLSLSEITEAMWQLRQRLMGSLTQTVVEHIHAPRVTQTHASCPKCERSVKSRRQGVRTLETLIGPLELSRPYFYCTACHHGFYPLDATLELAVGRQQGDVQKATAKLTTEVPYETAHDLFGALTGLSVSAERMHTLTNQLAEGLTVLDVAPDREAILEQIGALHRWKQRRPVMVLAIDGAHVPTRPDEAAELREAPKRHRARRARWQGQYKEAKGLRLYLLDAERIVHILSWHQIQDDEALGEALKQINAAGLIPQDQVRLCVIGDGAPWIWHQVKELFPSARQVLDYYHCAERVYKGAVAQYGQTLKALEWTEATLTRLYHGEVGHVIGGLKRMATDSEQSAHVMAKLIDYLSEHRHRTTYQKLRRGGYPLGSGGIESANKFICHVRLKRSGAWWYRGSSNRMLALRCAKYNGTFDRVFERYRERQKAS